MAAILALLTILPHALVLRRRPEDLGLLPDGIEPANSSQEVTARATHEPREELESVPLGAALRGPAFWLLSAAVFLGTLSQAAVYVHLVPYLSERGYGLGSAATLTGLIGASQVLGQVVDTFVEGRLPRDAVTAGIFALQAVALVVLIQSRSPLGVLLFVLGSAVAAVAMFMAERLVPPLRSEPGAKGSH